jgi:negative regulator of sigma E activity
LKKNIWGVAKQHNSEAAWIQDLKDQIKDIPQQPSMEISVDDVQKKVKWMSNWKAPGPDQVRQTGKHQYQTKSKHSG